MTKNTKWSLSVLILIISSLSIDFCVSDSSLNVVVIPAEYNRTYRYFINSTVEQIFLYKEVEEISLEGAKIFVESEDAATDDPLIVVVKQKLGTLSWQIPMYVAGDDQSDATVYNRTSRNLCPSKYYHSLKSGLQNKEETEIFVRISISTASKRSISYNLNLLPVSNFYLKSGESRNVTVNPSEPVYYGYTFKNSSSDVLVTVTSYYKEEVCMTFAIEPTECPVFDYQGNRHFIGLWQTVTSQGAITVSKQDYPNGFFIVLTVDPEMRRCSENDDEDYREKNVTLSISDAMSGTEYIFPTLVPLAAFIAFCVVYIIGALSSKMHLPPSLLINSDFEQGAGEINTTNEDASRSSSDEDPIVISVDRIHPENVNNAGDNHSSRDAICPVNVNNELLNSVDSGNKIACVRDLLTKEIKILRKNSHLYVHFLLIVGTFYAVPVMQLVVNYEKMLRVTGNQDLCYYNFRCAHQLGILTDFNHIFSNFGYVLLGLLFNFIVYMREKNDTLCHETAKDENPRQYGLFYAMGFASMMEGLLSASYHICPNHDNFQFDTSVMYIISVLCIMKLYQNRHPDITAEAHVTFSAIAITIILALAGVWGDDNKHFWIGFTIIYISFCLLLSVNIYYMKGWRSIKRKLPRILKSLRTGIRGRNIHPYYPKRLWLIVVGNVCNIGLAIFGNLNYRTIDFPAFLLWILIINLFIYLAYYIIMKWRHGEKILAQTWAHLFLSLVTWSVAIYFFQEQRLSFSDKPANAREHNQACLLWGFYDFHDIWHFLSAFALFFSFMMMFTLDDNTHTCNNDVF